MHTFPWTHWTKRMENTAIGRLCLCVCVCACYYCWLFFLHSMAAMVMVMAVYICCKHVNTHSTYSPRYTHIHLRSDWYLNDGNRAKKSEKNCKIQLSIKNCNYYIYWRYIYLISILFNWFSCSFIYFWVCYCCCCCFFSFLSYFFPWTVTNRLFSFQICWRYFSNKNGQTNYHIQFQW